MEVTGPPPQERGDRGEEGEGGEEGLAEAGLGGGDELVWVQEMKIEQTGAGLERLGGALALGIAGGVEEPAAVVEVSFSKPVELDGAGFEDGGHPEEGAEADGKCP